MSLYIWSSWFIILLNSLQQNDLVMFTNVMGPIRSFPWISDLIYRHEIPKMLSNRHVYCIVYTYNQQFINKN